MSKLLNKIVLDGNSPKETYEELFNTPVGQVFKISSDYETVMMRIEQYKPKNKKFEVFPITPGTTLYTMYGPDHCLITYNENTEISK